MHPPRLVRVAAPGTRARAATTARSAGNRGRGAPRGAATADVARGGEPGGSRSLGQGACPPPAPCERPRKEPLLGFARERLGARKPVLPDALPLHHGAAPALPPAGRPPCR